MLTYFWLCWVCLALCRPPPAGVTRGWSPGAAQELPILVASLVEEHGLYSTGPVVVAET